MTSLVIGSGFIGTALCASLRGHGIETTQSSRTHARADVTLRDGAALDAQLAGSAYDQIVLVGQLSRPDVDWVLERVDGPRWLIISSHQVTSAVPAPETEVALAHERWALARGGCILRPTMVYGKGRDPNITRLIRLIRRWGLAVVPGSGDQLVQPMHVDDLTELIARHGVAPLGGLFEVGGFEALPVRELVATVAEIVAARSLRLEIPTSVIRLGARFAGLSGMRPDQIDRLTEPKNVDWTAAAVAFDWEPAPLGVRLEQAVMESVDRTV